MRKRNNTSVLLLKAELPFERSALRVAFALLLILVSAYGYLIGTSIFNAIARKEAIAENVRLETSVGILEEDYFALSEGITPGTGATLGLGTLSEKEKSYVYRPGAVGVAGSAGTGL